MAEAVVGSPLLEVEGEQISLSTTADYLAIKPGFHEAKVYCPTEWRLALSPALLHCFYYTAAAGTYTEYKNLVTDRDSTTHLPLDGMLTTDYLYLGFSQPALGVYFDIGTNAQAVTATLDVEYCSTAVAQGTSIVFTDVSGDSDGSASGGATLAVDGVYTWTLPTPDSTWKRSTLGTHQAPIGSKCYWIRFAPSATLSDPTDIAEIIPIYQNTNYMYMEAGVVHEFSINTAKVGGFVFKATAGTPNLDVGWIKH